MTTQETVSWVEQLLAVAERVKAGEISPQVAVGEVFAAYETFLRTAYVARHLWHDREAKRLWDARPNLNSPAAELAWWARSMQVRARGAKRHFFTSPQLWAAIDAIMHGQAIWLCLKQLPAAWRWEP